jgi:hypothetical protein
MTFQKLWIDLVAKNPSWSDDDYIIKTQAIDFRRAMQQAYDIGHKASKQKTGASEAPGNDDAAAVLSSIFGGLR